MSSGAFSLAVVLSILAVASATGCRKEARHPGTTERTAPPAPASLLGGERGLDHVGVAVKDLPAAGQTFSLQLGFDRPIPGRLPNGIDNINFYFEDASYLELLTFYDRGKAAWLAWFIDHFTEGGNFTVLSVHSASDTAAFLRQRGFPMSAPSAGSIAIQGGKPGGSWQTLFFQRSPLPGSPLYFIEYPQQQRAEFLRKLTDPQVRRDSFHHRNTAVGIRAVWMAVRDLAAATQAYGDIGLQREEAFHSETLAAQGQSLAAGSGHILLFSPSKGDGHPGPPDAGGGAGDGGPVERFLDRRGPGVLGISVAVRSIDTARQVIGADKTATGAGPHDASFLVPPEHAHGLWIEFFQAAPDDQQ